MAIAEHIKQTMNSKKSAVIRNMFEEGIRLKKEYGADKIYDFSLGNPDLDPPAAVIEAVKQTALDLSKGRHSYMSNAGYMEVREAMAQKVSADQSLSGTQKLSGDHIVMTVGAAGALNAVFKAILNPQDRVLVSVPFFPEYTHYVQNHGGTLVPVQATDNLSLDAQAFERTFSDIDIDAKQGGAKGSVAAVLLNSPNNPSGKIYSKENVESLIAVFRSYGKKTGRMPYLVCDEPYREITYDGKTVPAVFPLYENSIIVTSFAKNLSLPGERIGYIAVNPACPDAGDLVSACTFANRILGFVNSPAFFQKVVAKSWNVPVDYSAYEKRCKLISSIVRDAGIDFIEPEGAFYLFCKVPTPKNIAHSGYKGDDFAFCDHLKKYRILCAPGSGFGCPGWFRMAYCISEQTIVHCAEPLNRACAEW